MKKIIAIALTLALAICLAVPAFADTVTTDNGTATKLVSAAYEAGSSATEVISVDVAWGSMTFIYQDAVEGTWNASEHSYSGAREAQWSYIGNEITVTNHSNTAVEAQLTFSDWFEFDIIEGSFTETSDTANDGKLLLATAVGTEYASAPSASAHFNVTSGSITEDGALGEITVKIVNK